jgi:hypothetical protein
MPLSGIGMSIAFASPCVDALLIVRRRRSGRTVQFDGVRSETDHAFAVGALESGVADCGVFAGEQAAAKVKRFQDDPVAAMIAA